MMPLMSIGFGIFLFAIGAILAFAVQIQVDWIDLRMVGYILMGAGFVVTILGLILMMRRRQSSSTTRTAVDPASGQRVTRQENSQDPL